MCRGISMPLTATSQLPQASMCFLSHPSPRAGGDPGKTLLDQKFFKYLRGSVTVNGSALNRKGNEILLHYGLTSSAAQ